jgi:hypothetical protein
VFKSEKAEGERGVKTELLKVDLLKSAEEKG